MAHLTLPVGSATPQFGRWVERDARLGASWGRGRIAGFVKIKATPTDIPVRRRVRLYRESDGALLREVWSDAKTGAYSFDWIDPSQRYTVVSYDYTHDKRAVIADNLVPEPMP